MSTRFRPLRFVPGLLFAALAAACASNAGDRAGTMTTQTASLYNATADWRFPAGTQPVTSSPDGMVSSTDRVASEVGAEILRRGGNAVDAAIATHFALAVVNPEAGNIGGGGFMVVRTPSGETAALDFREKAPLTVDRSMFVDENGEPNGASRVGYLANGVPGSVAGMWEAHQRFGSLDWAELVMPAVALADGIVMHERLAESLGRYEERLRQNDASAEAFLIDGRAPRVGERFAQPDLAATLRRIASDGKDGFYAGETARLIAAEMRRGGGLISERDLAEYDAVWRDPVRFDYRGFDVIAMSPPSTGGPTLGEMLQILEGYDLGSMEFHGVEHVHLFSEASKLAFADRNHYLADPDFVPQPVARMISEDYAAERRSQIEPRRATPSEEIEPGLGEAMAMTGTPVESANTTHYSVVDGRGTAVAVTTTLNSLYGNGITVTGAGFLLNNEMDDFTSAPGSPNMFGLVQGEANAIEPGKRMSSSMTPTIVVDPRGRLRLVAGAPGGPTIISTVAQVVSNVIDFGMDARDATGAPRLHHQHLPDVTQYENGGLQPSVVAELTAMGHDMEERNGYSGDMQLIVVGEDGTLYGASDPRRGGAAVGVARPIEVYQ